MVEVNLEGREWEYEEHPNIEGSRIRQMDVKDLSQGYRFYSSNSWSTEMGSAKSLGSHIDTLLEPGTAVGRYSIEFELEGKEKVPNSRTKRALGDITDARLWDYARERGRDFKYGVGDYADVNVALVPEGTHVFPTSEMESENELGESIIEDDYTLLVSTRQDDAREAVETVRDVAIDIEEELNRAVDDAKDDHWTTRQVVEEFGRKLTPENVREVATHVYDRACDSFWNRLHDATEQRTRETKQYQDIELDELERLLERDDPTEVIYNDERAGHLGDSAVEEILESFTVESPVDDEFYVESISIHAKEVGEDTRYTAELTGYPGSHFPLDEVDNPETLLEATIHLNEDNLGTTVESIREDHQSEPIEGKAVETA